MAIGDKIYIADKPTLDTVNGKLGATNDAQSSSTTTGSIFAKLNYLVNQIAVYLLSIYNNALKIGTTTETGGTATTGTVMGKLNDVIIKNGKLADNDGGFLTAISVLEGVVMPEVLRSEYQANPPVVIGVDETSVYILDDTLHKLSRLDKTTFVKTGEALPQVGTASGVIIDSTHIYYLDYTTKKVVKFLKSDMSMVLESSTYSGCNGMCADASYLYIYDYILKKVIKLDKVSLSAVGESIADSSISTNLGIQVDNTHVFLSSGGKFYKYNKLDLSLAQVSSVISGLNVFHCEEEDSGYLYFKTGSSVSSNIIKANKNFEYVSMFFSPKIVNYMSSITGDTNSIYVFDYDRGAILRIDKSSMNLLGIIEGFYATSAKVDDNYIYTQDTVAKVVVKCNKITTVPKYQIIGYTKE